MRLLRTLEDITRIGYCSARQIALMTWESGAVLFFMKTLDAPGLVGAEHPWATGDDAHGRGEKIWPAQIAYRSHRRIETAESDEEIVTRVGRFLSSMVRRSAAHELPQGPRRRMPHAVNYLHGAVHHNGLFMVFDDIPDVIEHLTDKRFRRTLKRLGRTEQREISLVLRSRKIDPEQYAYCIG